MKVKTVRASMGVTLNVEPYNVARGDFAIEVEVEDGETIDSVEEKLLDEVKKGVVVTLIESVDAFGALKDYCEKGTPDGIERILCVEEDEEDNEEG